MDLSIFPCGGRETLLRIFKKLNGTENNRCIFFADRDYWLFEGIPEEYAGIITTYGFSIENDVIADSNVASFYSNEENEFYEKIKKELSAWWACEISQHRLGKACNARKNFQEFIDGLNENPPRPFFDSNRYCEQYGYPALDHQLVSEVESNFERYIRGHQLLCLHQYIFSRKEDAQARNAGRGLLFTLFSIGGSPHLQMDIQNIKDALNSMHSRNSTRFVQTRENPIGQSRTYDG